jgi:hypothetical protein
MFYIIIFDLRHLVVGRNAWLLTYSSFPILLSLLVQGPGNYRVIAQNRRNEVTLIPRMGSFNIMMFLVSYIQADRYEPMMVEAVVYVFSDLKKATEIAKQVTTDADSAKILGAVLQGCPFHPGQVCSLCDQLKINRTASNDDFINPIIANSEDRAMAVFGEGCWADHWDYYLDLIEAYLAIYPDKEEELLYDNELRYFFSTAIVRPQSENYVLDFTFDGKKSKHVMKLLLGTVIPREILS